MAICRRGPQWNVYALHISPFRVMYWTILHTSQHGFYREWMTTQTFPIFSTRICSGETASSQQAWQEMDATGRDVCHASGFRGSVAGTSVRTAHSSQSSSPGPTVCATPPLEQPHRNAVPSSRGTELLLPQWRGTPRSRSALWRHGESLLHKDFVSSPFSAKLSHHIDYTMGWTIGIWLRAWVGIFLFTNVSRLVLGSTPPLSNRH
jgi:hypothetical protein